jgi:glycosyltransferase involved in cell wall biosynthesis
MRTTFVLWSGEIGGAENFTAELAGAIQAQGALAAVVFVQEGPPLVDRLDRLGISHCSIGFQRGRHVLSAPRRFAREIERSQPDVAILVSSGYLALALRLGGNRVPIVAIEHGSLLQHHRLPPLKRLTRTLDRASGARACNAVVAVSDYMKDRIILSRPGTPIVRISNGVDLQRFSPMPDGGAPDPHDGEVVIGCASRLVEGKGVEDVVRALAHPILRDARLRIAGDGPRDGALKLLARQLAVHDRTEFVGPVADMPAYWNSIDVAIVPSDAVESFGMAAVEAMACAKPVVVSDSGALSELVLDGVTGRVVRAGDIADIASALGEYGRDPARRKLHGLNGRRRCEREYAIDEVASRYLDLCSSLIQESSSKRTKVFGSCE